MSVCGYTIYELYGIVPYVMFVVTFLAFVLRCRLSGRGILLWTFFLALACSRLVVKYGDVPDVAKAFVSATNGEFRVLLQHQPVVEAQTDGSLSIDLQLSGHIHGGFMPGLRHRAANGYDDRIRGLCQVGKTTLCVSAGCGPWGGFPLRYRTPLEIGLITLKHVQERVLK